MQELFNKIEAMYNAAPTIYQWEKHNVPSDSLIYKAGMSHQARALASLPDVIRSKLDVPKVVGYHSSKSVRLPVSSFCLKVGMYNKGYSFIRDNFYDIKLSIVSEYGIHMPYHLVHKELSQEEYDAEKKRSWDYCERVSSDFDPKDYDSDAWMKKWSGDTFIRHNNKIYRAYSVRDVYCEGIDRLDLPNEVFQPYEDGRKMFTCSLGTYAQVGVILDLIQSSMEHEFFVERNRHLNEGKSE